MQTKEQVEDAFREDMPLIGCDDLRQWLMAQEFKLATNYFQSRDNACNWYAYRRIAIPTRVCECNSNKYMQLVVYPFKYNLHEKYRESAEVEITGEFGGVWYKLAAYSLNHDDLRAKLDEVERNLAAAWNALRPM